MPYEDLTAEFNVSIHRFGFDSLAKLMNWFTQDELRKLWLQGFSIVSYEIDSSRVVLGVKQLAFETQYATKVVEVCYTAEMNNPPVLEAA